MIFLSSSESGRAGLGEEGWFLRGMGMTSAVRSRAHRLTTPQTWRRVSPTASGQGCGLSKRNGPRMRVTEAASFGLVRAGRFRNLMGWSCRCCRVKSRNRRRSTHDESAVFGGRPCRGSKGRVDDHPTHRRTALPGSAPFFIALPRSVRRPTAAAGSLDRPWRRAAAKLRRRQ